MVTHCTVKQFCARHGIERLEVENAQLEAQVTDLMVQNTKLRAALEKLIFDYEEQLGTEAHEARRELEGKGK